MRIAAILVLAFVVIFRPTLVLAADAPKPVVLTASRSVELTADDLRVALVAISNAGAACDLGTKVYCDVERAREATVAKLQAALTALQAPGAAK